MLPFTTDQFLEVFAKYNNAIYPNQWVLILAALAAVIFSFTKNLKKTSVLLLAFLWAWAGVVYHLLFFTRIKGVAVLFGILFLVQSLIFIQIGAIQGSIGFQPRFNTRGVLGVFWMVYALVLYPLLNYLLGHQYPRSPSFGVPCPVTIFTFGLLFWTYRPIPLLVIVIPFFWTAIGASAAFLLGIYEDLGLLFVGVIYLIFWLMDSR